MSDSVSTPAKEVALLNQSFKLPCGIVAPNRLCKAAMEEMLGPLGGGDPNPSHFKLYRDWAEGNWGIVITGNVMVSSTHLGTPADVIIPPLSASPESKAKSLLAFQSWSKASHTSINPSPVVIMQLCHTGRQSMRGSGRPIGTPSKAPSAIALNSTKGFIEKTMGKLVWGTPDAMTIEDIAELVQEFLRGARMAKEAGFEGVQLHCSHGYLLAQFLSPNVNIRKDAYGVDARGRMKLVFDIIDAIRAEFPLTSGFCLGVKLNSSDYVQGGMTEADALNNVKWIAEHGGIDFIEISGGNYENPVMLREDDEQLADIAKLSSHPENLPATSRTASREAFFISFASSARSLLLSLELPKSNIPAIMVTGGFRTRTGMALAIESASTDFVGIGRPACIAPQLPLILLDSRLSSEEARSPRYSIKGTGLIRKLPIGLILPGVGTMWHTLILALVARGEKVDLDMTVAQGIWRVWLKTLLSNNALSILVIFGGLMAYLGRVFV